MQVGQKLTRITPRESGKTGKIDLNAADLSKTIRSTEGKLFTPKNKNIAPRTANLKLKTQNTIDDTVINVGKKKKSGALKKIGSKIKDIAIHPLDEITNPNYPGLLQAIFGGLIGALPPALLNVAGNLAVLTGSSQLAWAVGLSSLIGPLGVVCVAGGAAATVAIGTYRQQAKTKSDFKKREKLFAPKSESSTPKNKNTAPRVANLKLKTQNVIDDAVIKVEKKLGLTDQAWCRLLNQVNRNDLHGIEHNPIDMRASGRRKASNDLLYMTDNNGVTRGLADGQEVEVKDANGNRGTIVRKGDSIRVIDGKIKDADGNTLGNAVRFKRK